jgi:hypothetical protein
MPVQKADNNNNASQTQTADVSPESLLEQQKAEDQKNEIFTLKSNLEKSRHDLAENIAKNIAG